MTITAIDPPTLPKSPVFASGMLTTGGSTVWIGGQNGFGSDGVIPDDLAAESRQATENVLAVLAEAGGTIDNLVSVTVYFVAGVDMQVAWGAAAPLFGGHRCGVVALGVATLGRPDAHLEISGVAVLP